MIDFVFVFEFDVLCNVWFVCWLFFCLLSGFCEGLFIVCEGVQIFYFGDFVVVLCVEVWVCMLEVYWCLLIGGSLVVVEVWMDGDWESYQLMVLLQIFVCNGKVLGCLECGFCLLGKFVVCLCYWICCNICVQVWENIVVYYDFGNEFYVYFLDEDLFYFSVLFIDDQQDLIQVQWVKMVCLCDQLVFNFGDYLLEIGIGWGVLVEYVVCYYGCWVIIIIFFWEQYCWVIECMVCVGLQDCVEVLFCDYCDLCGEYDKLVLVEMIEVVGQCYLLVFFCICQVCLCLGGRMVLQVIIIQDQCYCDYSKSVDFIQCYIFFGGFLFSIIVMSELMICYIDFVVCNLFDMGLDYVCILVYWWQCFIYVWQDIEKFGFDECFCWMWFYYFGYCEVGFNVCIISVVQFIVEWV